MDYKLLHALSVLITQQSFEKAANVLCITQSAVSQRIKLLEQTIGQPVVVRAQPIVATAIGKKLLSHYQQVKLLEQDVLPDIFADQPEEILAVNLATNADSLATWLVPAIEKVVHQHKISVNFLVSDENRTIDFLKNGEAFGAISTYEKALPGCTFTKLGDIEYLLVASKAFKERYFINGINRQSIQLAPTVAFDQKDDMHIRYIEQQFGLAEGNYPCHTVRSSEAFVNFAKQGLAYCLIPKLQIKQELASGVLINLLPDNSLTRTLYWHRWVLLKGAFKQLSDAILTKGTQALVQQ
nr:LysR family transcriptional regulator ArgP [Thalassotalea insulae]